MTIRSRTITALIAAATIATGAGACSSDNDDATAAESTTTTTASASTASAEDTSDLTEFCAIATELNGATAPTQEQIDEYAALAPDEISEPVDTFVAAFTAADGNLGAVFSDPDAAAASEQIAAFESAQCGITPPGPPPGAGE